MDVRLFAALREDRGKIVSVQWYEGMNGFALLKSLAIEPETVSIFLINGMRSDPETLIKADDIIALFPPLGGG